MADHLHHLVHHWARTRPEHRALVFLDGDAEGPTLTYADLDLEVRRVAALIAERASHQDCALLVHSPGPRFVIDFLACLYAGVIPVPVYPPLGLREIQTAGKVAAATSPRLLLTDVAALVGDVAPDVPRLDSAAAAAAPIDGPVQTSDDDVALVQFTSGSTGDPRGAVITHANIVDNQRRIQAAFQQDAGAVIVSWLPLYHDMGLIGSVLHALYLGATCVLMSPVAFMQRPLRWLRAMSDFKGTITAAPNFAYEICARRATAADVEALDLTAWQVAVCGGEPVRASTVERFSAVFAPAGFSRTVFSPAYGLAEATLLVTGVGKGVTPSLAPRPADGEAGPGELVSNGPLGDGVVIASPEGDVLPAGRVGEIWVRQGSVARGYWGDPPGSEDVFGRRLANGEGGYLCTGDVGFAHDGELYVTGRSKDLLIVRGRNHWPQDLEVTVEQASGHVRPGCVAAVQVDDDVVVVAEARPGADAAAVVEAVTAAVAADHGVHLRAVKLLAPGEIPKTSSGKIRRRACRELYLADVRTPDAAALDVPLDGPVNEVLSLVAAILADGPVQADDSLVAAGLDSLSCVSLQYELECRFGVTVPLEALLQGASPRDLAALVASAEPVATPVAATAEDAGEPRLSIGQESVWLASQLRPDAAPFTIARAAAVPDALDVARVEQALAAVVERHPALRTRIVLDGARPRPVVDPAGPVAIEPIPPGPSAVEAVQTWVLRRFDLAREWPLRVGLLTPAQGPRILAVAIDHAAADLWSLSLALDELARLVAGQSLDDVVPGDPSSFARAEQARLAGPEGERLRAQWQSLLDGVPTDLDLPAAHRPALLSGRGRTVRVALGPGSSERLRHVASSLGVTPAAVGLAAFRLFLSKIGRNPDVVIGVPTALRADPRTHATVGFLVNTVPVRVAVGEGADVPALVRAARDGLAASMAGAALPIAEIVRAARERGVDGELVRAMYAHVSELPGLSSLVPLAMEDEGAEVDLGGGLVLRPVALPEQAVPSDFEVTTGESGGEVLVRFGASADLFDAEATDRLAHQFATLFRRVLDEPQSAAADLDLLDDAQRAALVAAATAHGPGLEARSLVELFLQAAEAHPDEPAVTFAGAAVSYRQLLAAVRRTAAAVRGALTADADADAETPLVGLVLEADPTFVVGLLAAWHAGAGVVPVARDIPDVRAARMLADAGVAAVLATPATRERAAALAPDAPAIDVVPPGPANDDPAAEDHDGAKPLATGDDVAYVIYTSGTSGTPKGVPITHDNVQPLLLWQRERFALEPGVRLAQTLSLSFDFGLQEVLTTVLFGATLCIPSPSERVSGPAYAAFLDREDVNLLYATPTFAAQLGAQRVSAPSVETLVLGGELLTGAALRSLADAFPAARTIVNGYGPTEASINCSMRFFDRSELADTPASALPVGPPTGRSRVGVVDAFGCLVPPGIAGEVVIGGPGVSSGYRNNPALTAERFRPGPWPDRGWSYWTGDLGRLDADGSLTILGRLDDQVKLSGYRIEPSEIEHVLCEHPQVAAAAVLPHRLGGRLRLRAFVVPADPSTGAEDVRRFAAGRLPSSVVPTIELLAELPRTSSGKLDRRALEAIRPTQDAAPAGNRHTEDVIARIWCEEIGIETVSRTDNFFDAGGYSLLVASVASRIQDAFALTDLPVAVVFEHPTITELAAVVDALASGAPASDLASNDLAHVARQRRRGRQAIRL